MTSVGLGSFNFGRELGDIDFIEVVGVPEIWLAIGEPEIESELGEIRLTGFISREGSIAVGLTDFPSFIAKNIFYATYIIFRCVTFENWFGWSIRRTWIGLNFFCIDR